MKLPWPEDAKRDERFLGMDGAVAELRLNGQAAGYALMTVQQWATLAGPFWRRRLVHPRDLPELHFAFRDKETRVQQGHDFDSWYADDPTEVGVLFDQCILGKRVDWDGRTYELCWLDAETSAQLRADLFWEPVAE